MTAEPPDWRHFGKLSDRVYHSALEGDYSGLSNHNIVDGANLEIAYYGHLARLTGRTLRLDSCLDVGCGSGGMTTALQRSASGHALGVDISPTAVDLAKRLHPECRFTALDASAPPAVLEGAPFSLILFREFHPFTRSGDHDLHLRILRDYQAFLAKEGLIVIGHARKGGHMDYPSLDFAHLRVSLASMGLSGIGPFFPFLHKHLRIPPLWRWQTCLFSSVAAVGAHLTGARWIECMLIWKNHG